MDESEDQADAPERASEATNPSSTKDSRCEVGEKKTCPVPEELSSPGCIEVCSGEARCEDCGDDGCQETCWKAGITCQQKCTGSEKGWGKCKCSLSVFVLGGVSYLLELDAEGIEKHGLEEAVKKEID